MANEWVTIQDTDDSEWVTIPDTGGSDGGDWETMSEKAGVDYTELTRKFGEETESIIQGTQPLLPFSEGIRGVPVNVAEMADPEQLQDPEKFRRVLQYASNEGEVRQFATARNNYFVRQASVAKADEAIQNIAVQAREQKGFIPAFGKGLARGTSSVISGVSGVMADYITKDFLPEMHEQRKHFRELGMSASLTPSEGGTAEYLGNLIGETLPYMATAMASGGIGLAVSGTALATLGAGFIGFSVEGENAYQNALASGATEKEAQRERWIVGSLNAIIEAAQIGRLFKFAKVGKTSLRALIAAMKGRAYKEAGKIGGKLFAKMIKHSFIEGLEEWMQENISQAAPGLLRGDYSKKPDGSPNWWAMFTRSGSAFLGGAVVGGILGTAGAAITAPGGQAQQEAVAPEVETARATGELDIESGVTPVTPTAESVEEEVYKRLDKSPDFQEAVSTASKAGTEARANQQEDGNPAKQESLDLAYQEAQANLDKQRDMMEQTVQEERAVDAELGVEVSLPIPQQHKGKTEFWERLHRRRETNQSALSQEEELVVQQIRDSSSEFQQALKDFEAIESFTPEARKAAKKVEKLTRNIDLQVQQMPIEEIRKRLPTLARPAPSVEAGTADEATGKQYGLEPAETNERLGKAELRYRELKNKPVSERTHDEKKELAFLKRNRANIEALLERETKPIEKLMSREEALDQGHTIPDRLGWTETQRRIFNKKITNQRSMKKMTPAQLKQLIVALTKEASKAGIKVEGGLIVSPVEELIMKLEERKQKPALTDRDERNMKKLRKIYYKMKSGTSFYFLYLSRIKRLCRALDNYETDGPFTRYIYQPMKDADTQAAVNFTAVMEGGVQGFEQMGIDVPKMFAEIIDTGVDDKLSTAERIGVWALAQNEKTRNHLLSEFTEAEIKKISKSVEANENEMLVAAEIQTYFETGWDGLKAIAEAHGITGLVKEENYITAFVKNKNDVADTDFMTGLMQEFTQSKFVPGEQHLIERKPGAKRSLELNIFMIHARAARAIERFKVMAPVADKVGRMMKYKVFQEALDNVTYGHGSRLLDKWLQDSIRGKSAYDPSAIGAALRWLRMRSVHFVLGGKVLTAAKQGISLLPAMGVHPGMAPLLLANISHNPYGAKYKAMEAETRAKSDMMVHRDWDRDLRQVYDKKAVKKLYADKKLSPLLMRMATWVDRHTSTAVWYSAYQLSQKHNMNEKDSIRFADGVVEDTQPMGKAVDLPAFFRGSELEKNFSIFQNQVNQNGNMLWYDILGETKAKKLSPTRMGYRLLMQQVVPALLLGMVSRGRLPEDFKELAKDLAFYVMSPYFVVGRTLYNMFIERDWGPSTGFIWETPITETFKAVGAVTKDKPASYANWDPARQEAWDKKHIKDIAKYGARAIGAWTGGKPPLQAIQTAEGAWNLVTGETDDFRELIWSKYALKKKKKEEKYEGYYKF